MPPPSGGYPFPVLGRFEILFFRRDIFFFNQTKQLLFLGLAHDQGPRTGTGRRQGWAGENTVSSMLEPRKMRSSLVCEALTL